jgi:hypothetical protein
MEKIMKKILLIALAVLSLNALAKDKVLLSCTTYGDALSEVQVLADAKGDQSIKIIEMDNTSKKLQVMMPTFFSDKKTQLVLSAARYPDSASGGAVDEAAILVISANKKSARLAHAGLIFFMDCR